MRFSFTFLASALPLLVASQASYSIYSSESDYYIYGAYIPSSGVNITADDSLDPPAVLTVLPTLAGAGAQDITIANDTWYIGVDIDRTHGPLVVWSESPYTWTVTPQPGGNYSVMDPQSRKLWYGRYDTYRDIVLVDHSDYHADPRWFFETVS